MRFPFSNYIVSQCGVMIFPTSFLIVLQGFLCFSTPISQHSLVTKTSDQPKLIKLKAFDESYPNVKYFIKILPKVGKLYQVSDYGTQLIGNQITESDILVTSKNHQIYYIPTLTLFSDTTFMSDSFSFYTATESQFSNLATVHITNPTGSIVGSNFLLSDENWMILGNSDTLDNVKYDSSTSDQLLNRFIFGKDNKINSQHFSDRYLFYFSAPSKFLGNQGIAYGGFLKLSLGLLSGNYSQFNNVNTAFVELYCDACDGPIHKGVRLYYPLSNIVLTSLQLGKSLSFQIPLLENSGWIKDSQNPLNQPLPITKCDLLTVLSRLSGLRILGDFLYSAETIALDDVALTNLKPQVPMCAMTKSDASICTC